MRFDFDIEKSRRLKSNPERGMSFEEVQALFDAEHIIDRRSDDPEQFRAIGWVKGKLYSVSMRFGRMPRVSCTIW